VTTQVVHLDLAENGYDIHIGSGLMANGALIREQVRGQQAFIVTNETVANHYLDSITESLVDLDVGVHKMQDGEQFKTLATLNAIVGDMLERGYNRSVTIIALGGGVVGDTAGFAAATYQRGVPFIQIPTTLLAQVDSSVGGKTAVNHPSGKNMIGAFYQPKAVFIDIDTLSSLPAREFSAGLAEVIKHGALADVDYFAEIERNMELLVSLDPAAVTSIIKGSCQIKAETVAADEKEAGRRALLNFGHTFGHAIETTMGYGAWLHGEAVGAGMVMATDLSCRLGRCTRDEAIRVKRLIEKAGLPVAPPAELSSSLMIQAMSKDKKVDDSGLRFVLLAGGIGKSELVSDVPQSVLMETLEAGTALCE
jgi:3-dehydroquinate synthase